jgi:WD40 repeat protein/DNA-binding SARP family transcriptional activator
MDFRCLGPLTVVEGDHVVPLGGPRQRLVLAHLLLDANHHVATERLIDLVWGETPPEAARASVQSYVSHLRRALGDGRIESHRQAYLLRVDADELDLTRFEALAAEGRRSLTADPAAAAAALERALAEWRGVAFADLASEPSLSSAVAHLAAQRLAVVEDRIAADLAQGHSTELTAELEHLTAAHPLRERLWGSLMLALYRSGRQAEALAAFERARQRLAGELGIDPSPELQRLHERILRQDPDLQPAGDQLRGYRLLEVLGEGRLGVVHRAMQPHVGREVAVKVVPALLADDPEFVRRFDAEAQIVARLEHPHLVPLYDYWREPGGAYLVMRLLRGGDLRQRIEGPDPPGQDEAVSVIDQVASALAAAHRQGVVHGAVDAADVLFDEIGNAYLTGFGFGPRAPGGSGPGEAPMRDGAPRPVDDVAGIGRLMDRLLEDPPAAVGAVIRRATAVDPRRRYPDVTALHDAFRGALDGPGTAGTERSPRGARAVNPYKGLRAFSEVDAADFFGRETLTARLLTRLRQEGPAGRFLALVGPSGGGKSSVVRAGLVPALRAGALPGSDRWYVVQMTPATDPLRELAVALLGVAIEPLEELTSHLAEGADGLSEVIEGALPDTEGELVLVIDQFEELFTLVVDAGRRQAFLTALTRAVRVPTSRVRVVITLRGDLYDRPLHHPGIAELVRTGTEVAVPLSAEELGRAIRAPAARVGVDVEAELIARIISDVNEQPGALPLLQYALTELFDRQPVGPLTASGYLALGGVSGALARRAEEVYDTLTDEGRATARQLFLRLVALGEDGQATARRASRAELDGLHLDHRVLTPVIEALGTARLLSFDRDPETREPTVQLAHESILRAWARLRGWIDGARDDVRIQRRLAVAASEWLAADREPSFLLSGARLERLETWRRTSGLALTPVEEQFLDASIAERDQRRAIEAARVAHEEELERGSMRRLRTLVVVLCVAAFVASALTVFGFGQWQQARREGARAEEEAFVARSRELAASAVANLTADPQRSMLLALEAIDGTRDRLGWVLPEAEEALHRAVGASRTLLNATGVGGAVSWSPMGVFVTEGPEDSGVIDLRDEDTGASVRSWQGHDVDVNDVRFSPDGIMLATAGDDGAVRLWDPATGDLRWEVDGGEQSWRPSFSADGTLLAASWIAERTVLVIDTATGEVVTEVGPIEGPFATALSPDGRELAVSAAWADGEVLRFDARTGEARDTLRGHGGTVETAAYSLDGRWLATASADATVRIWEAVTGEVRYTLHGHTAALRDLAWSPVDPTRLVSGGNDGTVRVWEVTSDGAREVLRLSARDARGVTGVAFSPDGERVLAGDNLTEAAQIWDVSAEGGGEWGNYLARPMTYNAVAFMPDGEQLVVTSDPDAVTVWDLRTRAPVRTIGPHEEVGRITTSPDGELITTLGLEIARTWVARTGAAAFAVIREDHWAEDASWSPDGELLATAGGEAVRLTDRRGEEVASYRAGPELVSLRSRFHPEGRMIATVWVNRTRFDPSLAQVRIWDWERDEVVLELPTSADHVEFEPTGRSIAVANPNGSIELWELGTGRRVAELVGHQGPLTSIRFGPDGSLLVSSGSDGTIRLWDPATATQKLQLAGSATVVHELAISPDGTRLASADGAGLVRVWALDLDDLIEIARGKLTRELSDDECRQYLHVARCPER